MPADRPVTAPPAATCVDVTYRYADVGEAVTALSSYSADFPAGQVSVVAGPSGSGKSTLLRLLAGIEPPSSGTIHVGLVRLDSLGERARRRFRRQNISYLFQAQADNLISSLDAVDHLTHAAAVRQTHLPRDPGVLLRTVGLERCAHRRPAQLSGGEQQRLAVLCATIGDPALVLADEPTAQLDSGATEGVLDLVEQFAHAGTTFVIASHDPLVIERATTLSVLDYGVTTMSGTVTS